VSTDANTGEVHKVNVFFEKIPFVTNANTWDVKKMELQHYANRFTGQSYCTGFLGDSNSTATDFFFCSSHAVAIPVCVP
jgi:hypothetical protein